MAISIPTVLDSRTGGDSSLSVFATNSISPSANSLVLVLVSKSVGWDSSYADPATTTLNTVGPFVRIQEAFISNLNAYKGAIFAAIMTDTPGTGTITVTHDQTNPKWNIITLEVASGFDPIIPIRQSGNGVGAFVWTVEVTLGPVWSNSLIVGCCEVRGKWANSVPGDNYTELVDLYCCGGGSNSDSALQAQYDLGASSNICNWSCSHSNTNFGIAVEIADELGPPGGQGPVIQVV